MSSNPDEIRADIERTRSELSSDVDQLVEEVNPKNVARRQVDKVTGKAASVRDKVMGGASDTAGSIGGTASSLGDRASSLGDRAAGAPSAAKRQAQGNPLAAGVIAFGAGMLVASLLPATDKEAELARTAKDKAEPLKDEVSSVAKEAAQNLKEPAQQAAQSVKETARDGAQTVKQEGTSAAQDVRSDAQGAAQDVRQGQ